MYKTMHKGEKETAFWPPTNLSDGEGPHRKERPDEVPRVAEEPIAQDFFEGDSAV